MGAKTDAEVLQAEEEAAPEYMRSRVERGEPLPTLQLAWQEEEEGAVLDFAVMRMGGNLFVELMRGLAHRPLRGADAGMPRWHDC